MSFQIDRIVLLGRNGQTRQLQFKLGALNIITGISATGKSSIFDVIDYCLASSDYPVAAGVVRNSVRMYGLVLHTGSGQILVARPAPDAGRQTNSRMYIGVGDFGENSPDLNLIRTNSDVDSAKAFLSEICGIGENQFVPETGTRSPLTATIRHALHFVFQSQNEIADPTLLFHSQGLEYRPQAIRDALPYFLGAVDAEAIWKRNQIRLLSRELKAIERSASDFANADDPTPRMRALIEEAVAAGLTSAEERARIESRDGFLRLLADVAVRVDPPPLQAPDHDRYSELTDRRAQLRLELARVRAEIGGLTRLAAETTGFISEAAEQQARLATLDLLPIEDGVNVDVCPVCSSQLTQAIPLVSEIRDGLQRVSSEIEAARRGRPRLQSIASELEESARRIRDDLRENQIALDEIRATSDALERFQEEAVRRALVRGRISLFLDGQRRTAADDAIARSREDVAAEIERLQRELDDSGSQERLDSALSRISNTITDLAKNLSLEHSESPVRLNLRKLTVVADTPSGPVALNEMGSAANWMGYHVCVMLALHDYFIRNSRPVPRLLTLDQPSQVYFPPDAASDSELDDADREGLRQILLRLIEAIDRFSPNFQVIMTEHADLDDSWFQDAVIEKWRNGRALIPQDWIG